MPNRLFLLDCMALLYRAHFALISKPIFTSDGVNTSALYGFANTVLDILLNQKPTHLGAAFDTQAPTPRHELFPQYKAQRDEIPEDLAVAIPAAKRLLKAMNIPVLEKDGSVVALVREGGDASCLVFVASDTLTVDGKKRLVFLRPGDEERFVMKL